MKPYIVFDLDGTLAPPGKACLPENVSLLKEIENAGAGIVLSSGKPTFYLCGFVRQLGLQNAILIGENGGVLQVGVELPPPLYKEMPIPEKTKEALKELKAKLLNSFPERIWYQPNETILTPFPAFQEDFPLIKKLLQDFITPDMLLSVYEHPDCFDIVYSSLSKGEGIKLLQSVTGADPSDMIAVGNWTNDYPMFQAVGYSVGICLPDPEMASVNFSDLSSALKHLLDRIQNR